MINENIYREAKKIFMNEKISITKLANRFNINRKELSIKLKEDGIYKGKGYTKEQAEYALTEMKKGKTLVDICKELNVARHTFVHYLKENSYIETKEDVSYETYKEMINEYLYTDKSSEEIYKKYKIGEEKFYYILRVHNVSRDREKSCLYNVDETYFETIDTEEKAYWLGFLMADGYIGKDSIELTLKESDYKHIEKFKKSIKSTSIIKYREKQKAYRIIISSKKMINDLTNLGCMQNKSLILKYPKNIIPENLEKHFIRGYFDGDGCLGLYVANKKDKIKQAQLSVLGTKDFIDNVEFILIKNCDLKKRNKYYMNGKAYSIYYRGNRQCLRILDYLYRDSTIYLDRKYKIYKDIIAVLECNHK